MLGPLNYDNEISNRLLHDNENGIGPINDENGNLMRNGSSHMEREVDHHIDNIGIGDGIQSIGQMVENNIQSQDCYVCLEPVSDNEGIGGDCCIRRYHPRCFLRLLSNYHGECPQCRSSIFHHNGPQRYEDLLRRFDINPIDLLEQSRDTRDHNRIRNEGPPNQPNEYLLQCCHRQILLSSDPPIFGPTPDRTMEWSSSWNRHSGSWDSEWMCQPCGRTISPGHPSLRINQTVPLCPRHGPRTLMIDYFTHLREWVCTSQSIYQQVLDCEAEIVDEAFPIDENGHPQASSDARPGYHHPDGRENGAGDIPRLNGDMRMETNDDNPGTMVNQGLDQETIPVQEIGRSWRVPSEYVNERTNSFLYMPLFLAAADLLPRNDNEAWMNHPSSAEWWNNAVTILRIAPAVPLREIADALHLISDGIAISNTLREFNQDELFDLPRLIRTITPRGHHLPPEVQDVILQTYADTGYSRTLDGYADAFRDPLRLLLGPNGVRNNNGNVSTPTTLIPPPPPPPNLSSNTDGNREGGRRPRGRPRRDQSRGPYPSGTTTTEVHVIRPTTRISLEPQA